MAWNSETGSVTINKSPRIPAANLNSLLIASLEAARMTITAGFCASRSVVGGLTVLELVA